MRQPVREGRGNDQLADAWQWEPFEGGACRSFGGALSTVRARPPRASRSVDRANLRNSRQPPLTHMGENLIAGSCGAATVAPRAPLRTVSPMTITTQETIDHSWAEGLGLQQLPEPHTQLSVSQGRALVVVRESNEYDFMAFSTMIRQVLEPLSGRLPGVAEVLEECGHTAEVMRPTPRGDALRARWGASVLRQDSRPYGYLFEVGGTYFFFAMTSAFSDASEDLGNSFTDDLLANVNRLRPTALYTGPATRIVRRKDLGERLGRELGLRQVRVFTKELPEGIDPGKDSGSVNWTFLCLTAEADLRTTLTRLLTGRIYRVRQNGWLAGANMLPLGFALEEGELKRPILGDAQDVACARLLLHAAARAWTDIKTGAAPDPEAVPRKILTELARLGATKRSNRKANSYGTPIAGVAVDTVVDPKMTLISLLNELSAYSHAGILRRPQQLPMPGLNQHDVHGMTIYVPVRKDGAATAPDPNAKGTIFFDWTFPKPLDSAGEPEAWASEDVLAEAAAYLNYLKSTSAQPWSTRAAHPFSGMFKANEDGQYLHLVHSGTGYQVRISSGRAYYKSKSAAIGKFDNDDFNRAFVDALINKIEVEGIDPRQVRFRQPRQPSTPEVSDTQNRLTALTAQFHSAQASSRAATTALSRRDHQQTADGLALQIEALQEVADREATARETTQECEPDRLDVSDLATLLSLVLDSSSKGLPTAVCRLLQSMIVDGRIEQCWDDSAPWARFRCSVRLQAEHGITRPVEVVFEVGNTTQGTDRKAFDRRMRQVLELRMTTDASVEELAARLGRQPTPSHVGQCLGAALTTVFTDRGVPPKNARAAAVALIDCPIASTREIVWRTLHRQALPRTIENLDEKDSARHTEAIVDRYLSPQFSWSVKAWSSGGERKRREMLRYVEARGDVAGTSLTELQHSLGLAENIGFVTSHVHDVKARKDDAIARVLEAHPSATRGPRGGGAPSLVRRRACPHCRERLPLPLPVPETGADPVLCGSCMRLADDPTHVFPDSYRELWEGPFGRAVTDTNAVPPVGQRTGTRRGEAPKMPSVSRSLQAKKHRASRRANE